MVISTVNQVVYNGDGITTAWPFTFRIIDATDIKLLLIDADGTETDVSADYYVDMVNNTVYYPGYAPGAEPPEEDQPPKVQTGQKLVVYRELPITQEADLGDKWPFKVIENGLDKLTMILQQIFDWWGRTLKISQGGSVDGFDTNVYPEAGKVIAVNEDGDGFECRDAMMEVNGAWDGEGRQIHSVADPTADQDAVTKKYADTRMDSNFMKLQPDGTAWEGRNLPISNVAGPALVRDAANKDYVDRILAGYSGHGDRFVFFDNVEQMQAAAATLAPSQMAVTLGYYDVNDGGAGVYTIRDIGADTPDGGSIIEITGTSYVAELITDGTVCPEQWGAIESGVCNIAKFQKMIDFAISAKQNIKLVSDFEFQFIPNSTIDSPTRLLIKNCDKMIVDGGGHTVTMTGLTTDYLFSIDDDASSGRDVFTFLSFVLCNNIVVQNLNVNGEFVNDLSVAFRYQSPRAKAIGFFGTYYSYVNNCNFDGILGNGVNFTPSSNTRDGSWRNCAYCTVSNVNVRNSLENGLNNMGTTYAIEYTNITATNCTGGIETGIGQSHISNSSFYQCNNSIALGGNDTADNVYCKSCGVYLNSSRDVVISNSTFIIYRAVYMMPGEGSVTFNSCNIMVDEDVEWAGTYNISVYCVGTSEKHIKALILNACYLKIKGLPMQTNYLDNLIINGCHINTTSGNILTMYNTPNALMLSTLYNGGVAGTFINTLADTNYKYT